MDASSQMDPRKALVLMVSPAFLFCENWDMVSKDVIRYCHDVFEGKKDICEINDTVVVLIHKVRDPKDIMNFRSIGLCRAIFKIISKVLANRLKMVLHSCISHNPSAFVLSRMIHDYILIAHELVHYLQSPKNGPNKGLVIKLDMSKAYDRVE
ncbi:uncharacterized protein LOC128036149 [Gossypium raimondii]|uniref:uncharacterized protein LOC128036149 n=1 Tax=Gossypium raimondii TaxID=29730 RepID=UPI00227B8D92|nr:uncharacterized protein LOC128036149 [Gossypium raimondii]